MDCNYFTIALWGGPYGKLCHPVDTRNELYFVAEIYPNPISFIMAVSFYSMTLSLSMPKNYFKHKLYLYIFSAVKLFHKRDNTIYHHPSHHLTVFFNCWYTEFIIHMSDTCENYYPDTSVQLAGISSLSCWVGTDVTIGNDCTVHMHWVV